ncbi:DUF218 domain-containing protein [Dyadobacter jejuensis]|uniref:DUF218 domain-containing protein n=1 Tax=Dyadobacter jejuensis TaxID=1082580 RepID=A0A316AM48_9BACT|nr:YdcF family protein [Dyadobacter jejuensis]PWJ58508.1 DUF218 domain-containing protein [Dyadobacter jejuensis]
MRSILLILLLFYCSSCAKILYKRAAKSFHEHRQESPYDAIIVPGYPYSGTSWNRILQLRIHWANFLYQKGYADNIIFSGGAVATRFVESKIMASYAEGLGVDPQHIFMESQAEHSTENVYYSYRLAKELGFQHVALATDPFQNSFMEKFTKKFDLPIASLPMVIDTIRKMDTYEPCIDSMRSIKKDFVKLSEKENFFERFRGTLGKNIIWHREDLKKKKFQRRFKDRTVSNE